MSLRRTFLPMVVVALALRLGVVAFLYPERLNPNRDYWRFAGETGRIARSIVEGKGFSSPLFADTGPTAWMGPIFPYILAGIFKIFGVYTKSSAIAALSLNAFFSALTCVPVFFIARKSLGDREAVWAGWGWAFFPFAIYFSADFIWSTVLTTFLLGLIFLAALHLEDSPSLLRWSGFGVLAGFSALNDPVVLSVAPFLALWMCYRLYRKGNRWFAPAVGAALTFVLVVSPWFVRNYRVFHKLIPFRDNIGLELRVGNNGATYHWAPGGFHPSDSAVEWNKYQQMGELAYMAEKQREALDFIEGHPGWFVVMTSRRILYMWTSFWSFKPLYLAEEPFDIPNIFLTTILSILAFIGLRRAFRNDAAGAAPYAIVLFFFPLVYYLTHWEDYYRRPIDWVFVILAANVFVSQRSRSAGLVGITTGRPTHPKS